MKGRFEYDGCRSAGIHRTEKGTYHRHLFHSGEVIWLEKGAGKPSTWTKKDKTIEDAVSFDKTSAAVAVDSENNAETVNAINAVFTIENTPGAALPNTGGVGKIPLYLSGIMLTGIACSGLVMWKRREEP